MLHIEKVSDSTFEAMVAIPINKRLEGNGKIFSKRFVPWKVLTAEIRGGNYTVDEALKEMEMYLNDYDIPAMAIPFSSFFTARRNQQYHSKGVTKI